MTFTDDQVVAALDGVVPEKKIRELLSGRIEGGFGRRFFLVERTWPGGFKSYHLRKRPDGGRVRMGYRNFTERVAQLPALGELLWRKL
jgi:hypothetical protein